jgi:hypothetical protein
MRTRFAIAVLFGVLCSAVSGSAHAQGTTATLFGNVADKTGASVPGAKVTATNLDTNISTTVPSSAVGEYRLDLLPVGRYKIVVSAPGFEKFVRANVPLTVDQQARVDVSLTPGGENDTITVTDEPPAINLENGTVGRTIETQEVDKLPIVDRNVYSLFNLVAGVQSNSFGNTLGYPQQVVQINGGTTGNNTGTVSYYLDGGLNMTALRNTGNQVPNPEAIAEFNVETSNYNATYGRMSSGVVNVLTKSGTNQLHGSAYEFNRNTDFNATPFNATSKQPFHRNSFGGVLGGPVRKDKTFLFGEYSGLRLTQGTHLTGSVLPTTSGGMTNTGEAGGDFSAFLPTTSGAITTCTQTLSATDKAAGDFIVCNPVTRKPFTNNIITSTLDPAAQAILKTLPAANVGVGTNTPSYNGYITLPSRSNEFEVKGDHQISPRQRVELLYFYLTGSNTIQAGSGNLPWAYQLQTYSQHNVNLSDTFTLSPNKINQTWLTYTRLFGGRNNSPSTPLTSFGSNFAAQGPPSLPQITVTGYFTLSNAIGGPEAGTNFYSARDLFIYNIGKHSLQLGGEASLNKDVQLTLLNNYGVFGFSGSTSARSGNALADFILGYQASQTQDAPVTAIDNSFFYSAFAQDDWRILPNLTINVGLRWDLQTPPTDPQNKESTFVPGRQSTVNPLMPNGELVVGDSGVTRGTIPTRYQHFSPRLGLAFDPFKNGKTSVRASAGLFWGSVSGNEWNASSNYYPFSLRYTFPVVGTLSNPYLNSPSPFPYVYTPGAVKPIVTGGSIEGAAPNFQWPYTYQLTASVQQQMNKSLVVGIAYVGALARDLPFSSDINYPVFNAASPASNTTGNVLSRRPYDTGVLGQIFAVQSSQTANYNAMQVTFQQRVTKGISFNGFYTFSKTMDSAALDSGTAPEDFSLPKLDKGPSNYDQRSLFVTSVVWTPNYAMGNRYARAVVNGWSLSTIVRLGSGPAFNITTGSDNNLDGNTTDRPIQTGLLYSSSVNRKSRSQLDKAFFNKASFCSYSVTAPTACLGAGAAGQDGTAQRDGYYGPAQRDVDMALFRSFKIVGRLQFEARAEVSNVFNLVTLGNPNGTLSSANAGTITAQASNFNMRQIQLGGRLKF